MNESTVCLSPALLRELARRDLPPRRMAELEEHLTQCEKCRCVIEEFDGDVQWKSELRAAMAGNVSVDGSRPSRVSYDDEPQAETDDSLQGLLSLLGPTDDPHMLGRIGGYEIVGVVGRGGMGVVFKAFDAPLNRFVAIKMLLPHLAVSGAARKRFAREGRAAAAVIDDNVMPIYSVAEWQGIPYLVTQYSGGVTLQKRIQQQGPLELKVILRVGMQTARGLAAAHAQGLVHRDVKPSNILLDGTVERAMLTDFGLARAVDDASITRTGMIAGTPQYMSPEQARSGSVDARSDLFSLGSVLYAACTGRPPFRADNSYAILRLITDEEPRAICEINPETPQWLGSIITKLMSKNPDDRYPTAEEVGRLLEDCLAHVQQPAVAPLPAALAHPATVRSSFHVPRKGIIAMLTLFGVLFSGLFFMQLPITSGTPDKLLPGVPDKPDKPDSKGKQLGTVLGKPIYASARNKNVEIGEDLERLFLRPVEEHYLTEQKIDPALELAKRIPNEGMRAAALPMVRQRILHKHLYEKSGGRVQLTAFGPIAYDAYKQWIADRENKGDFKITDPDEHKALLAKWNHDPEPKLTDDKKTIKEAFDPALMEQFLTAMAGPPAGAVGNPKIKLIGEVLGQRIYLEQQQLHDKAQLSGLLHDLIIPKLEERCWKDHPEIEPTDVEIDAVAALLKADRADTVIAFQADLDNVIKRLAVAKPDSDEFRDLTLQKKALNRMLQNADTRPRAATLVRVRKLQKHLYDQYDGGRVLQTARGLEAFDAQKRWVKAQEQLGAFQIADPKLCDIFYEYWTAGPHLKGKMLVEDLEKSKQQLNAPIDKQRK